MKTILWDFDGTIFNTYPSLVQNFIQIAGRDLDPQEVMKYMKKTLGETLDHFGLSKDLVEEFHQRERDIEAKDKPPFPGVENVLKFAAKNVIVSHKTEASMKEILKYYGMEHYFSEMIGKESGYPRKPDPAAYKYLHEKYGVDLIIGDRELDILPGKALGIKTCLFQNDTVGADYYLYDYANFFKVVKL